MSHSIPISDELYRAIEKLARQQDSTVESVVETLLEDRIAEREAIAAQNAEWEAELDEALSRATAGENTPYDSVEAFFAMLDEEVRDSDDQ